MSPTLGTCFARLLLVVVFAWLTGRFWDTYYGFTRFLQMNTHTLARCEPVLRQAPIFTYTEGYDGQFYAQLAAHPAVKDPLLARSIDTVGYRARRILLSWMAWALAGGNPVNAVRTYAWLNLAVWAGLAGLLWVLFPVRVGWRGTLAWAGILFSAGALHSVRMALTDLLALLLVASGVMAVERKRFGWASTWVGLGGLARETVLLGLTALLPGNRSKPRDWLRAVGWGTLAVLPLGVWGLYLQAAEPGTNNLAWPLTGWATKWSELFYDLSHGSNPGLTLTTLLAHVALSVQVIYVLLRPAPKDLWWRVGAAYGVLLLILGTAVWEGYPGAVDRVLLPLTLVFNVLVVRRHAPWGWLILGNLGVFSGFMTLSHVPIDHFRLTAGHTDHGAYLVHVNQQWYDIETLGNRHWVWCRQQGTLIIDVYPRRPQIKVSVAAKGFTPRPLNISQAGQIAWSGRIGTTPQWIELSDIKVTNGKARLRFDTTAPPQLENDTPTGRELGFAVYGVKVD